MKAHGIWQHTRCLYTIEKSIYKGIIVIGGDGTNKFCLGIDAPQYWYHLIPQLEITIGANALIIWLIAKLIYLTARTSISHNMLVKDDIKDIVQHAHTHHAAILNSLQALLYLTIGGGVIIGEAFVEEEGAHKRKMRIFQSLLDTT